jgi:Txe/YoeB family toxin of toxin-antitoxin system
LVKYQIVFTKQAQKDAEKIKKNNLKDKVEKLLEILKDDPYKNPPSYEKLVGDLKGAYSRRINIQHRLVYQIYDKEKIVKIIRMWTHYE